LARGGKFLAIFDLFEEDGDRLIGIDGRGHGLVIA
jgi:hypothetical protein